MATGCRKNLDTTTTMDEPTRFVRSALYGTVTGPSGTPLPGVTLRRGPYTQTTDEYGYFYFQESPLDVQGVPVHIRAPGFFSLTKMVIPQRDQPTPIAISLSPRILRGVWSATEGGTVSVGVSSVLFPGGSIVDAQGEAYTGDVRVFATFLSPLQSDPAPRMPGDLTGIREDGSLAVLATYGILGFELESAVGAPLQIAPGANLSLRIGLGDEQIDRAPPEIPLWYFDEHGRWIERGTAQLIDGAYVGEVDRLSYWTSAIANEFVQVHGRIVLPDGTSLAHAPVRIYSKGNPGALVSDKSYPLLLTNVDGRFEGWVPAHKDLILSVGTACDAEVLHLNIPALQQATDLGNLVIQKWDRALAISTRLLDCQAEPLAAPSYLHLMTAGGSQNLPVDQEGRVSTAIFKCLSAQIKGFPVDVHQQKQGATRTYSAETTQPVNMGNWLACDDLTEQVHITIDGYSTTLNHNLKAWTPTNNPNDLKVTAHAANPLDSMWFLLHLAADPAQPLGVSPVVNIRIQTATGALKWVGCSGTGGCADLQVELTQLGQVGEFVIGRIQGTLASHPSAPQSEVHTLKSHFVIRRSP
jgi:hypothetical protein